MEHLTEIAVVIDKSGSMYDLRKDTIGGFNSFMDEQRKHEGKVNVTLALFNTSYELVYDGENIDDIPYLTEDDYVPSGNTALYDAIGRTIDGIDQRLQGLPDAEKPDTVIVAILTDGFENSSTDYNQVSIFQMIKEKREQHDWEFVFLAANQDAMKSGASIAIPHKSTYNFTADSDGTQQIYKDLSTHTSTIRFSRSGRGKKPDPKNGPKNRLDFGIDDDDETLGFNKPDKE